MQITNKKMKTVFKNYSLERIFLLTFGRLTASLLTTELQLCLDLSNPGRPGMFRFRPSRRIEPYQVVPDSTILNTVIALRVVGLTVSWGRAP